jgi:hypothetical protein
MLRVVVRRAFATWMAVWFALVSVDPTWLHACPMHGAVPVAAQEGHGGAMAHHDHAQMPDGDSSPEQGHTCSCLGDCASGTAAPLVRAGFAVPVAAHVTIEPTHVVLPGVLRATRQAFVLPFATAPPVAMT